jgi:YegS/Rv2252/BmrU family lipid kinase
VIANPAAGRRRARDAHEEAARGLARAGLRVELFRTSGPRDAEGAARAAVGSFDLVLAAGGDGTVHEVANGLAGSTTPMGIVPLGSLNVLARELGIPMALEGACAWIGRAEPAAIALGRKDDRYFILMAGIGFDAWALRLAMGRAEAAGRKVRMRDYAVAALAGTRRYSFPRIEVEAGGRALHGAFGFLLNCARYGTNIRIGRRARLEEPLLDLVLFRSTGLLPIARYLLEIFLGRHDRDPTVSYEKITQARLRGPRGEEVLCQLDGEPSGALPALFQAAPGALHLLRARGTR